MAFPPRSLFGRTLLLIAILIAVGQVSTAVFYRIFVQEPRLGRFVSYAANQIEATEALLDSVAPDGRAAYLQRIGRAPSVAVRAGASPAGVAVTTPPPLARALMRRLDAALERPHPMLWEGGPNPRLWVALSLGGEPYWIGITIDRVVGEVSLTWVAMSIAVGALALVGAWWTQRHLNRPLQRLAASAQALGAGRAFTPLPEEGPLETVAVSRSFNRMAAALAQAQSDRDLLLAGVSHDLRTPLAKLRLALELLATQPDAALVAAMQGHIAHIDGILTEFLLYVRGFAGESIERVDLRVFLLQLAAEASAGDVTWSVDAPEPALHEVRPTALRRALANLMENAERYGRPDFVLEMRTVGDRRVIAVLDRGPGIPPEDYDRVVKPFVRLERDCAEETGTGLGLAIAARVAAEHGGSVSFAARPGGGLEARLALPVLHQGLMPVRAPDALWRDERADEPGAERRASPGQSVIA